MLRWLYQLSLVASVTATLLSSELLAGWPLGHHHGCPCAVCKKWSFYWKKPLPPYGRNCSELPCGTDMSCPPQGPFFGYFPTCWHRWPDGWNHCPVSSWESRHMVGMGPVPVGPPLPYIPEGEMLPPRPNMDPIPVPPTPPEPAPPLPGRAESPSPADRHTRYERSVPTKTDSRLFGPPAAHLAPAENRTQVPSVVPSAHAAPAVHSPTGNRRPVLQPVVAGHRAALTESVPQRIPVPEVRVEVPAEPALVLRTSAPPASSGPHPLPPVAAEQKLFGMLKLPGRRQRPARRLAPEVDVQYANPLRD